MRKRSPKRCSGRRCASCRSKLRNIWICRPCIECESAGWREEPPSSTRSAASCWTWIDSAQRPKSCGSCCFPEILGGPRPAAVGSFPRAVGQLKLELEQLCARIEQMDASDPANGSENEACQRLTEIPGVGPVTATALLRRLATPPAFEEGKIGGLGRDGSPEYSTGGKQKLLGISKRGNSYLRRLFVQGARS